MYYIIALFTFVLSLQTSWLYNNFTYLSYQPTLRIYFLIWITVVATFLLIKTIKLLKYSYITRLDKLLLGLNFISILLGSYLPYNPNNTNISSSLHIILSSAASLLYLIIIQIIINRLILSDYDVYKQINIIYHRLITILIMFIVMFGSINTIIELFVLFTILFILNKIENTLKF